LDCGIALKNDRGIALKNDRGIALKNDRGIALKNDRGIVPRILRLRPRILRQDQTDSLPDSFALGAS